MITDYALAFGGLLFLGGRIADYAGRKRVFVIGLIGFASASALGGLAPPPRECVQAEPVEALRALADESGLTLIQLAIVFTARHPAVTSASIGPAQWNTSMFRYWPKC